VGVNWYNSCLSSHNLVRCRTFFIRLQINFAVILIKLWLCHRHRPRPSVDGMISVQKLYDESFWILDTIIPDTKWRFALTLSIVTLLVSKQEAIRYKNGCFCYLHSLFIFWFWSFTVVNSLDNQCQINSVIMLLLQTCTVFDIKGPKG
jgi:hypothetical protein